jgi:hypothetical protein
MTTPTPSQPHDPSSALTAPDPTATLVSLSALDFLLIELVPMAYRITSDLALREEQEDSSSTSKPIDGSSDNDVGSTGGTGTGMGMMGLGHGLDEDETRESVFHRLESLGYRVGLGIVERYVTLILPSRSSPTNTYHRFSRTTPRPTDPLSTIKFLCKDLWTLLFRKQIDNLKTNHRGIYVLSDNKFKPLTRMSFDTKKMPAGAASGEGGDMAMAGDPNTMARAQPFLYFPAGLVRGCLAGLGLTATVTAESSELPVATFQIRTVGAKA